LDYEVIEFALSYAVPRKDVKAIAKRLLSEFKTISNILDAPIEKLGAIKGISEHTALFINFLKDIAIRYLKSGIYNKNLVSSPQDVYNYLKVSLKGMANEIFKALFLDTRNHLISEGIMQEGTINKSVVYPRRIVEQALENHSAGLIIAHNHPAGSLTPSKDDMQITKVIADALKTVDIRLLDHVIIGGNGYFSFKENNIIT